jgi:hypothetical protein
VTAASRAVTFAMRSVTFAMRSVTFVSAASAHRERVRAILDRHVMTCACATTASAPELREEPSGLECADCGRAVVRRDQRPMEAPSASARRGL